MKKYYPEAGKKIRGIIKCSDDRPENDRWKKYNYIDNTIRGVTTFLQFAKTKFPDAELCNFYNKETSQFIEKIHLS